MKLTKMQRELFKSLTDIPGGGVLRAHIKTTGTVCYRLLDEKYNPVKNYPYGVVTRLEDKGVIALQQNGDYILKATVE